jgi:hypothetical protein
MFNMLMSSLIYGKSPFFIGKSTISMAMFNSYVTNYQRVMVFWWWNMWKQNTVGRLTLESATGAWWAQGAGSSARSQNRLQHWKKSSHVFGQSQYFHGLNLEFRDGSMPW